MDSLVFRCPGCQQPFQVLAEQAGQLVRCPGCEDTVQVPAAPTTTTTTTAKTEAVSPTQSSPKQRENKADSKADSKTKSQQKSEEVQAYGCPKCEKPFGIYPSMMGSEMACPHCQQTVLLQPKAKSSTAVASSPAVKSKRKSKPKPKSKGETPAENRPLPQTADQKPKTGAPVSSEQIPEPPKSTQPPKSTAPTFSPVDKLGVQPDAADLSPSPVIVDPGEQTAIDLLDQKTETEQVDEPVEAPVVLFVAQPVDHLLPPKFGAVDPAFFYRRHQDGSQVLLPSEDGSLRVVNNRIVKIEHNGQVYELISSPEYDRMQKAIVNNLLAVVICGLLIAIVMALVNG